MNLHNRKIQIIFKSQHSDDIIEIIKKLSLVPLASSYQDTIKVLVQKTQTDESDYKMISNIKASINK